MIIGSVALNYHLGVSNQPKDIDIILGSGQNITPVLNLFPDIRVENLENPVLIDYYKGGCPLYIGLSELYTLKISHSLWDLKNGSFDKHLFHIQQLKDKGAEFIPELFYRLFPYWEQLHGKRKTSNLELSAEEFFNNALKYDVPHDDLHLILIEHPYFQGQKQPTYTKILKEGAEVDVCMDKFQALTEEEKFNVVFEEICVMAFEPRFPEKMHWRRRYELMLRKFITHHAKIEESLWIIQNHKKLLTQIPFNFIQFLNSKLHEPTESK